MILYLENTTVIDFLGWLKDKAGKYGFMMNYDEAGLIIQDTSTSRFTKTEKSISENFYPVRVYLSKIHPNGLAYDNDGLFIIEKVGTRLKICPKAYNFEGRENLASILVEISKDWSETYARLIHEIDFIKYDDYHENENFRFNVDPIGKELTEIKNDQLGKKNTNGDTQETNVEIMQEPEWRKLYKLNIENKNKNHEVIELFHEGLTYSKIAIKAKIGEGCDAKIRTQEVKNKIGSLRDKLLDIGGEDLRLKVLPFRGKNESKVE